MTKEVVHLSEAEQQRAHDTGGVDATYRTAMAAAIAVDVSETEAAGAPNDPGW